MRGDSAVHMINGRVNNRATNFRKPDGSLYAEELMGQEGFTSDASLLYHRELPTAIVAAEPVEEEPAEVVANHPLLPRHFRTHQLKVGGDPVAGRHLLLANQDVRLWYMAASAPSPLYRNAVGDECLYVESGAGRFESVFGAFDVQQGDYLVIPTSTTWRLLPAGSGGLTSEAPTTAAGGPGKPSGSGPVERRWWP